MVDPGLSRGSEEDKEFIKNSLNPSGLHVRDGTLTPTLNGSLQTLIYNGNVKRNTNGAYNTSTGIWLVEFDNFYNISARYGVFGTPALNNSSQIAIIKNGSEEIGKHVHTYSLATTGTEGISITMLSVPLVAGNTIEIQGLSNITSPLFNNSDSQNYFTISTSL